MVTCGICWFALGDFAASVITKLAVSGLSPFKAKAYGVLPSCMNNILLLDDDQINKDYNNCIYYLNLHHL